MGFRRRIGFSWSVVESISTRFGAQDLGRVSEKLKSQLGIVAAYGASPKPWGPEHKPCTGLRMVVGAEIVSKTIAGLHIALTV